MNKLLHADFNRIVKNKGAWIGVGATVAACAVMLGASYRDKIRFDAAVESQELVFRFLALTGIVMAAVVSLFAGTEYRDGTIRNKIVAGCDRKKIYLSGFLTAAAYGAALYLIGIVLSLGVAIPLFGKIKMDGKMFFLLLVDGLLLHIAYAALFYLIAALVTRREYSAVVSILLIFALLLVSSYLLNCLMQPEVSTFAQLSGETGDMTLMEEQNPHYISGRKREIYQFILDFLPAGQSAELSSMSVVHPLRMLFCSLAVTLLCVVGGMWAFERKDIK